MSGTDSADWTNTVTVYDQSGTPTSVGSGPQCDNYLYDSTNNTSEILIGKPAGQSIYVFSWELYFPPGGGTTHYTIALSDSGRSFAIFSTLGGVALAGGAGGPTVASGPLGPIKLVGNLWMNYTDPSPGPIPSGFPNFSIRYTTA